jgi:hypothetical protein
MGMSSYRSNMRPDGTSVAYPPANRMLVAALLRKHAEGSHRCARFLRRHRRGTDPGAQAINVDGKPLPRIQPRWIGPRHDGEAQARQPHRYSSGLIGCGGSRVVAPRRILVGGVEHGEAPGGASCSSRVANSSRHSVAGRCLTVRDRERGGCRVRRDRGAAWWFHFHPLLP